MSKKDENTGFTCINCGAEVKAATNGSYRNHCPFCLCSLHVDETPGDRASECFGIMRPESMRYNTQKGWQILHRCEKCGFQRFNLTVSDGEQPDDSKKILGLMRGNG